MQYLDLPAGTIVRMRSAKGSDIVVKTLEPRAEDPLVGHRWHPIYGEIQYVAVLEAPRAYHDPVVMLVGRLPEGAEASLDLDILHARTDELASGATVLLGSHCLVVAEVSLA